MTYAAKTEVSAAKTKAEIETLLQRHMAAAIATMQESGRAQVAFRMADRNILFRLPLPVIEDFTHDGRNSERSPEKQRAAWEQACRSRWRALFLTIKAKLESIASGIETFEDAFLANITLPDGQTVGEVTRPRIAATYAGHTVPLLPAP